MNAKKNILLIDDDDDELELFNLALGELEITYTCRHARTYKDALTILKAITPDLLFLDMNMPRMNGLECLKEIKQIQNLEEVPVLMYSTHMDERTCKKAIELGASACIKKPSEVSHLRMILNKIIQANSFAGEIIGYT